MKTQKHLESTVRVKTQTTEIEVSRHKNNRQRGDVVKNTKPTGRWVSRQKKQTGSGQNTNDRQGSIRTERRQKDRGKT